MKSILKQRIKVAYFVPIFILLVISPLFSDKFQKIDQRRHLFFTIQKDKLSPSPIGTTGELYTQKDTSPVGTFKIIDQSDGAYLCRLESVQKKEDLKIQWAVVRPERSAVKRSNIQLGSFSFAPISDVSDSFLSAAPHLVKNVSPISTNGIKNYLFRIENLSGKKYTANLIAFESLQSMNLGQAVKSIGRKKILLGTRGGQICMIYQEEGNIRCSQISDETIWKFRDSLCFYIVLKKN